MLCLIVQGFRSWRCSLTHRLHHYEQGIYNETECALRMKLVQKLMPTYEILGVRLLPILNISTSLQKNIGRLLKSGAVTGYSGNIFQRSLVAGHETGETIAYPTYSRPTYPPYYLSYLSAAYISFPTRPSRALHEKRITEVH